MGPGLMKFTTTTPKTFQLPGDPAGGSGAHFSNELLEKAHADNDTVLKELNSQLSGLNPGGENLVLSPVWYITVFSVPVSLNISRSHHILRPKESFHTFPLVSPIDLIIRH